MPVVSVVPVLGQTTILDSYDVAFASGNKYQIESSLPNGKTLRGTARTPIGYQLSINGRGSYTCYEPTSIEVSLGLIESAHIVVDAHYYPNSCNYQAILDHENRHVEIARSAVMAHAMEVRAGVERAVAAILPSLAFQANSGEVLKATVEQAITASLGGLVEDMRQRNADLDSPSSYQMTQNLCPSW
jgi:hypothetical protein